MVAYNFGFATNLYWRCPIWGYPSSSKPLDNCSIEPHGFEIAHLKKPLKPHIQLELGPKATYVTPLNMISH